MKKNELRAIMKIDSPTYEVDNGKNFSFYKNKAISINNGPKNIIAVICIILAIFIVLTIAIINVKIYTETSESKIDTNFFAIDDSSIKKADYPIKLGYKAEHNNFSSTDSLKLEVLIGYFGDLQSNILYPNDSDLPKIVLRTNENPIVEYELIKIDNFIEKYKLNYVRSEKNTICGCIYAFPDDAKGIILEIDNNYFTKTYGEIRIGLYVGYMYKATTICYCKNNEKGTIFISNISLDEAMKNANYD